VLCPRFPVCLWRLGAPSPNPRDFTPTYYTTLSSLFLALNAFHYPQKKKQNNISKCSAFASSPLLYLFFHFNSAVFVDSGRKNISCPRAQGTLATPLWSRYLDKCMSAYTCNDCKNVYDYRILFNLSVETKFVFPSCMLCCSLI